MLNLPTWIRKVNLLKHTLFAGNILFPADLTSFTFWFMSSIILYLFINGVATWYDCKLHYCLPLTTKRDMIQVLKVYLSPKCKYHLIWNWNELHCISNAIFRFNRCRAFQWLVEIFYFNYFFFIIIKGKLCSEYEAR